MDNEFKGFDLLEELKIKFPDFREKLEKYIKLGKVRYFNENEWNKIKNQNYMDVIEDIVYDDFYDVFCDGKNIGFCTTMVKQLSYSYNDVALVAGRVPMFVGTKNSSHGGHKWLEDGEHIIDTSLLLVIDKDIISEFGYKEEKRYTAQDLRNNKIYQSTKERINDLYLKKKHK